MRALFLTHRLPYAPNRGDRIRAYHLLRTLSQAAEVHLVSLVHDDEEERHVGDMDGAAARITTARVPRVRNLARGLARLRTTMPLTHSLLDAPDLPGRLRAIVEAEPPDVVLAYCSGMARLALDEPLKRFPLVLDMVDVDSAKWAALARASRPPMSWIYARETRCLGRFEATAAMAAASTLVTTDRERETLLAIAPEAPVHVVANGIDLDYFRPPQPPPEAVEPLVVFCGVMSYAPNRQAALWLAREIWPRVKARRSDAKLAIVGASPDATIRRLSAADPSIEVTGGVPDVRPWLWRAATSVAPLAIARGVQNKVLEAIAAGLPCIVTPVVHDGLPRQATNACRTAEDAASTADAIVEMLALPSERRRAIAASADLSALSWETQLRPAVDLVVAASTAGRIL